MPKSKEYIESSDSASDGESKSKTVPKKSKAKNSNSSDNPPAKRAKTSEETHDEGVASKKGTNGENLYEIGKLRYVSVSEFRGKPYVNIREYYEDKGIEKPGKKGISLTGDQWEKLKSLIAQVDKDLQRSK